MNGVLIVEDNASLAFALRRSLEAAGFRATVVSEGDAALAAARASPPELIVLDLMLPGRDGFEVLREIRAEGLEVPVLILSARGEEIDKLQGFRLGADDYVVKPVGVLELIARVEAILRRAGSRPGGDNADDVSDAPLSFGDVVVDPRRRTVEKAGHPVELAPLEFDLLLCLLRNQGAVVQRERLLREVWAYKNPVNTRTIDTHVAALRSKLEEHPADPRHILTVRKVGYRLQE